jgi:ATP-binding cassette subfamily F protein 3
MIKLLAGTEPLSTGSYTLGHNALPDYFAQDQYKELNPQRRMLDDLSDAAPRSTQTQLRTLLGCFLFSEDDVFKQIGVLSGGERNRYALARMLLAPSNFLLLDEPTNHLDLETREALTIALQEFEGAVVVVSHDRHLLRATADDFLIISEGRVAAFDGDLEDYRGWVAERRRGQQAPREREAKAPVDRKQQRRLEAEERNRRSAQRRPLEKRLQALETEMARLTAERTRVETLLAAPHLYEDQSRDQLQAFLTDQSRVTARLKDLEEQWLDLQTQLEALEPGQV